MTALGADLELGVDRRIAEVAARIDASRLGEAMADLLISSIPEFTGRADPDFRATLAMSCTSNLAAIKDALVTGAPVEDLTPPADAAAWARELVHRGMPVAALLRAYRLGHGMFERAFEQACSAVELEPDLRWRVLAGAARRVFTYIDIVCTQLVDDYETEREQWLRGAAATQVELVHAIVAGRHTEPESASKTLRHDVLAPQVGFIVWTDDQPTASPASVARRLGADLGGTQTLVIPISERAAWGWAAGREVDAGQASRATALDDRTGVAVGRRHAGAEGMFRTHQEARAARRVGEIFGAPPGRVLRYHAVALASLVTADPREAADFAITELGSQLGADTDAMRRLRATVRVYLEERLSRSRAARRLNVHENTIGYRIKKAEEALGRALDDRRLELEIALRLHEGLDGLRAAESPPGRDVTP